MICRERSMRFGHTVAFFAVLFCCASNVFCFVVRFRGDHCSAVGLKRKVFKAVCRVGIAKKNRFKSRHFNCFSTIVSVDNLR